MGLTFWRGLAAGMGLKRTVGTTAVERDVVEALVSMMVLMIVFWRVV